MQIYTNFESNSQQTSRDMAWATGCFRCKFTQILKAIHNLTAAALVVLNVVSDANLHKFWKQFTTVFCLTWCLSQLFPMQIYTNFESNSQPNNHPMFRNTVVSDANLHKFWKQFTTDNTAQIIINGLFPMQIYTNFESNSQQNDVLQDVSTCCFRCKFTQILKAIHNKHPATC